MDLLCNQGLILYGQGYVQIRIARTEDIVMVYVTMPVLAAAETMAVELQGEEVK